MNNSTKYILTSVSFLILFLFFQIGNVLAAAPTNGLVGYWNYDEGSGTTAADSSGNGNNGTLINGPTWTAGKVGSGALVFNGANSYINAGSSASLDNIQNQGGGGMTVSFWINPASNAANYILSKGPHSNLSGTWEITKSSATNPARVGFFKEGATDLNSSWNSVLTTGVWQHVVLTWDGTMIANGLSLYKNGLLVAKSVTDGSSPNSDAANNLFIGSSNGTSGFLDASLDEVRIYNRVLTSQEIQDIYNDTGSGTTPPSQPSSDTTAPSVPTGLSANALSTSQVNLSWTASTDNIAVTGYKIFRNGAQIGTSLATSYADTNLSASTQYTYTVSAYDSAGNNSSQSSSVSATTQATAGPHIYSVKKDGTGNFTTIQACANTAVAGDTCEVYPGLYDERVTITKSGMSNNRIVFKGATTTKPQVRAFSIINASNITISEMEITNAGMTYEVARNIEISSSSNISILNNTFVDTTYVCIRASGSTFVTVSGNTASYCGKVNVIDGTVKQNFIITSGVNDAVKYSVQGVSHTATLTAGTRTLLQICADINAVTPGVCSASNDAGTIELLSTTTGTTSNIILEAVVNDAYATLGLSVGPGHFIGNSIFAQGGSVANDGYLIDNNNVSHVGDYITLGHDTRVVIRNNKWGPSDPVNANHIDGVQTGVAPGVTYLLYEGNVSTDNNNYDNHFALFQGLDNNEILRYNTTFRTNGGVDCSRQNNPTGPGVYFYNNTFYDNAKYYPGNLGCGTSVNNLALNNIWYNASTPGAANPYIYTATSSLARDYDLWYAGTGNPKEVHAVNADPRFVDGLAGDFHLQSSSPAIDTGGPLTTTISSGLNSVSLSVGIASVFQDGWAGVLPDCIAVGNVSNVACVLSINYFTNVITLSSPLSWFAGAPVYLFKDSSGRQVLYGSAPDIGAYEYVSSVVTPPPTYTPGDFNHDGVVNSLDYSLLNSNWFKTTNISLYDLQADGIINSFDYAIFKSNWGK